MSAVVQDAKAEALRRAKDIEAQEHASWAAEDAALLDAEIANEPALPFLGQVLDTVEPQFIKWLSQGRLAEGKTTILDGDPGQGKSTVSIEWAAKVTRGIPLPDGPKLPPRGVVLMSAEDDPGDTIRPRADAAGADVSKILVLTDRPDGGLLSIPNDLPLIERELLRMDAALLVIDPLVAFLDPGVNVNKDQDVRRALAPVRAMAERTGVAVLLIRHMNKGGGGNALYRGGGSIAVIGAARFGLIVGADPDIEGRFLIASSKCNLARKPDTLAYRLESVPGSDVAQVAWDGTSTVNASALLMAADDRAQDDGDGDEVRAWLADYLSTGPKPSEEVWREARRLGHGEKAVKRAKAALKAKATKEGFGQAGRWSWSLPDHEVVPDHRGHQADQSLNPASLTRLDPLRPFKPCTDLLSNVHTIKYLHNIDDVRGSDEGLRSTKKAKGPNENGSDHLDPWNAPIRLFAVEPQPVCVQCGAAIDSGQRFCSDCDPRGM